MRNLVVAVVGDSSLHCIWLADHPQFDLFVIYYGDIENRYEADGKYYDRAKGTKFNILHQIAVQRPEIFAEYDAIFVPDDDLFMATDTINGFFKTFHEYKLEVAQPAVLGWISAPITAHIPFTVLRYVNWVEIMCPCFSSQAFGKCLPTFIENKTNWSIELLWDKVLDNPQDKIAIVDEYIAIHTRPCFYGDTYWNNNNTLETAVNDVNALLKKYNIQDRRVVYKTIPKDTSKFDNLESNDKFVPDIAYLKSFVSSLRFSGMKHA